jgi:type IV pilus assembly protein PilV
MAHTLNRRQRGVALVEVLVAMLVVSVGVLAMAGLLAMASRYGKTSEYRAVATLLASDMADRIRANKAALIADVTDYDVTNEYDDWGDEPAEPGECASASQCTPAEIAARDIAEWSQSVYGALPGGAGFVSVSEVGDAGGPRRNYAADVWIAWLDPDADSGLPTADRECPPAFQGEEPQPRCTFFRMGL